MLARFFGILCLLCLPVAFCVALDVEEADEPEISAAEGAVEAYDLRLEFLSEPRGVDEPTPRFSWKLRSEEQGQSQSAYRIVVYKTKRTSPILSQPVDTAWDSGKVVGTSQLVEYAGKPLEPKSEYTWTLTVWDGARKPSLAAVATFSTGISKWDGKWIGLDRFSLEDSDEKKDSLKLDGAAWIWLDEKGTGNAPVGKFAFRKEFELAVPQAARLTAHAAFAADNGYTFYVNGEKAGAGSNFKTANIVDVTKFLKPGRNVLAFEVTNHGETPNPAGLLGLLRIRFEDGKTLEIKTDETWQCAVGLPEGFNRVSANESGSDWKNAVKIADLGAGPWGEIAVATAWPSPPARYLRKAFQPEKDKEIVRVTAYIAGLGYYELYLNGNRIGDHLLDPVLTDYDKRVPYISYELDPKDFDTKRHVHFPPSTAGTATSAWTTGECVVGVVLGNGRYYAPRNNEPAPTRHFGYPKMILQLELEYKDGSSKTIVSDESWLLSTNGPIRDNNDYDGEIYDARKKLPEAWNTWDIPNGRRFDAESPDWKSAEVVAAPKGKLVAQMMPPMRAVEEFPALSCTEVKPGVWVFDFGVNLVGNCTFKKPVQTYVIERQVGGQTVPEQRVRTLPEGTVVTIRHAETLQTEGPDKGMLYVENLRGAKCRDIYIPGIAITYTPTFSYHGFRYAEITGLPEGFKPTKETLTARAINTDLPKVGRFETSSETINAVFRNVVRGTQGNYLSIPTDCPQRDERQGWQGDRAGESKGEMFLFDNVTLYSKWLTDIEDSQRDDGNLSDVCPNFWPLYGSNVTWPSAFTIIPDSIYTMYGDRRPIERHYEAMKRWLIGHLGQFVVDGIIDKDNYGDWCVPPEKPELIHSQDPARKTSKAILATAYYIHNLDLLEKYAQMLGKDTEAKGFASKAANMRKAFNDKFFNAETAKYDNGTQTSCVLPLYFGIVPEGQRKSVFETLVKNIETVTDMHIGTGLIGGQWLNRVLSDNGRADIAYTFATNKTYPSWGYMVEQGATTIWELWNGNTADPAMNSGNHVMLIGDLVIWYYEYLAGISGDPANPGFAHIIMKPHPVGDLKYVDAEYDSVRGPIKSSWKRDGDRFRWEIEIPVGSTATVHVPGGKTKTIPSGRHVFESNL